LGGRRTGRGAKCRGAAILARRHLGRASRLRRVRASVAVPACQRRFGTRSTTAGREPRRGRVLLPKQRRALADQRRVAFRGCRQRGPAFSLGANRTRVSASGVRASVRALRQTEFCTPGRSTGAFISAGTAGSGGNGGATE
jgi:hypothetical protein